MVYFTCQYFKFFHVFRHKPCIWVIHLVPNNHIQHLCLSSPFSSSKHFLRMNMYLYSERIDNRNAQVNSKLILSSGRAAEKFKGNYSS